MDGIHFAWWGDSELNHRHHYRVQGKTFIIEYNNTQNNANHVHSMWRRRRRRFQHSTRSGEVGQPSVAEFVRIPRLSSARIKSLTNSETPQTVAGSEYHDPGRCGRQPRKVNHIKTSEGGSPRGYDRLPPTGRRGPACRPPPGHPRASAKPGRLPASLPARGTPPRM